jgi:lysophospholipase L1-like esterase
MLTTCRRVRRVFRLGLAFILLFGGCTDMRFPDPAVRYVAFGDSSTKGPSTRDYPDILREQMGEAPETFANEGSGGETSEEGVDRLNELLSNGIFPNAEVLFYWQGGNDITEFIGDFDPFLIFSPDEEGYLFSGPLANRLDETQANIEAAISSAQEAGLVVYVATYYFLRENIAECDPLPLDILLPGQAVNANAYVAMLNERIRQAAARQGAFLVDVAAEDEVIRADPANYFNCNHLSEQGNEIIAGLFFDAVTAAVE